jgi:hypothetical protein
VKTATLDLVGIINIGHGKKVPNLKTKRRIRMLNEGSDCQNRKRLRSLINPTKSRTSKQRGTTDTVLLTT